MAGGKKMHEGWMQTTEGKRSPTTPETGNVNTFTPCALRDGTRVKYFGKDEVLSDHIGKRRASILGIAGVVSATYRRRCRRIELDALSGVRHSECRPPFAYRLRSPGNGPLSLGVELDTGVPPSGPITTDQERLQPIGCSKGIAEELSLSARRISTLISGRPEIMPTMDEGWDALGDAAGLAAVARCRDRCAPSCLWARLPVPVQQR